MKLYVVVPLVVSALCLVWIWIANRRPRLAGALWPKGMSLHGSVERPDVTVDGDLVLGCAGRFAAIHCRVLTVARGAQVSAETVEAAEIRVEGALETSGRVAAGRALRVTGTLKADDVQSPRIVLAAGAAATVLTVTGKTKIERHPKAVVKGFFETPDELKLAAADRVSPDHWATTTQPSLQ